MKNLKRFDELNEDDKVEIWPESKINENTAAQRDLQKQIEKLIKSCVDMSPQDVYDVLHLLAERQKNFI
jgi:hypothetical protein